VSKIERERNRAKEYGVSVGEKASESGGKVDCKNEEARAEEWVCPSKFPYTQASVYGGRQKADCYI
jgi:hypothetical protein